MNKLCKTCGSTYDSSNDYCPFCGSKEYEAITPVVNRAPKKPKTDPAEEIIKTRTNLNTEFSAVAAILWVIGLVILLAGLVYGIYVLIVDEIALGIVLIVISVLCSFLSFGLNRACKAVELAHERIDTIEKELNKMKSKK